MPNVVKKFNCIINTNISILCFLGKEEGNTEAWKTITDPSSGSIQPTDTVSVSHGL